MDALENSALLDGAREIRSPRAVFRAARIVLVDDDDRFRESLCLDLIDEGYEVTGFASGVAVLDHFASGGYADVILLDWRMPDMNGLEVLRSLGSMRNATPVIFLKVANDDAYEEAALESGAVDFIDKTCRLSILLTRLRLVARGVRCAPRQQGRQLGATFRLGRLELRLDINRATWGGVPIELTLTEFRIFALLALRTGEDVSYREIYDLVHGKDFAAGYGNDGYRCNVRTFIKRIRQKLHAVDPGFDRIVNYAGFGYRLSLDADR